MFGASDSSNVLILIETRSPKPASLKFNSSRNGNVAASFPVDEGDEVILSTDKGKVIRCAVKEIRTAGRNTQGVRIFKISDEEKVVSAFKIDDNFS